MRYPSIVRGILIGSLVLSGGAAFASGEDVKKAETDKKAAAAETEATKPATETEGKTEGKTEEGKTDEGKKDDDATPAKPQVNTLEDIHAAADARALFLAGGETPATEVVWRPAE